jgi:hypothetical protein
MLQMGRIGIKIFWNILCETLNLHSFQKDGLPDSIMVVRQILVLFVLVRIQVGQQRPRTTCGVFAFRSEANVFAGADGCKNLSAEGAGAFG